MTAVAALENLTPRSAAASNGPLWLITVCTTRDKREHGAIEAPAQELYLSSAQAPAIIIIAETQG